jgi:hypothetical protein
MRVPLYLEIAQWALLFALGLLVVVMYRQLGRLLSKPAATAELGPAVGTMASPFRYQKLPGGMTAQFSPGAGQPWLLAFADPSCPACEQLVTSLSTMQADGELAGAGILLLISDPPGYLSISAAFQATTLEIGRPLTVTEIAGYRATGTPLLVAIDGTGRVRAAGVARQVPEIRAFAAAITGQANGAVTITESEGVR